MIALFAVALMLALVNTSDGDAKTSENDAGDQIAVWMDCDPGLDDTIAIIYAAMSKRINIIGFSTSGGNTNLKSTTKNTLDILYNIGR